MGYDVNRVRLYATMAGGDIGHDGDHLVFIGDIALQRATAARSRRR